MKTRPPPPRSRSSSREDLLVEDWGIPDFQRDGVAAWRFQPSADAQPDQSVRHALRLRRLSQHHHPDPRRQGRHRPRENPPAPPRNASWIRFPRAVTAEVYLQVPKLEFEATPLPAGAPEGFENAVGNFRLSASTAVTEVQEGDPISVDLIVSGSGNLDTLRPPRLENASGWKVYEHHHRATRRRAPPTLRQRRFPPVHPPAGTEVGDPALPPGLLRPEGRRLQDPHHRAHRPENAARTRRRTPPLRPPSRRLPCPSSA